MLNRGHELTGKVIAEVELWLEVRQPSEAVWSLIQISLLILCPCPHMNCLGAF